MDEIRVIWLVIVKGYVLNLISWKILCKVFVMLCFEIVCKRDEVKILV